MSYTGKHVGFIGGGQLARMAIYRTKKLGLRFSALDPDPFCGVAGLVDRLIVGSLHDPAKLRELARGVDVMTYDIEHVGVDALIELEAEGFEIHPSPRLLAAVQDKLIQKNLFQE
ncbi:MAG: 5-(carboxyamino)imidazole ribonucleotide synthase, partial [Spirochaetales bacterium]|nr:5-(carboxyamino)imidazole ribonucleotide synthase [Spirochaetales bacterium]